MATQPDPPSEPIRIGAICLLVLGVVGAVAFLIAAIHEAMS